MLLLVKRTVKPATQN